MQTLSACMLQACFPKYHASIYNLFVSQERTVYFLYTHITIRRVFVCIGIGLHYRLHISLIDSAAVSIDRNLSKSFMVIQICQYCRSIIIIIRLVFIERRIIAATARPTV